MNTEHRQSAAELEYISMHIHFLGEFVCQNKTTLKMHNLHRLDHRFLLAYIQYEPVYRIKSFD